MNNINPVQLRRLDLNSLVVLHTLLTTCSVSASAEKLCLGQPAVSHILKRLRQRTGDPLLYRHGRGMVLTPLAASLLQPLTQWLQQGQQLLQPQAFDPATAQAKVRLAMPDLLEVALLPALIIQLQDCAPGLQLEVQAMPSAEVGQALESQRIDCAIGYFPHLTSRLRRQTLLVSRFVCLHHQDRLQLPATLRAADLADVPHVYTSYAGDSASMVDDYLHQHGLQRRILVSMASLLAIPALLEQLPAVSVLPDVIGQVVSQRSHGLQLKPIADADLSIGVELLWHPGLEADPLQAFLRQRICHQAAQLQVSLDRAAAACRSGRSSG